jgi:hypothetical protein
MKKSSANEFVNNPYNFFHQNRNFLALILHWWLVFNYIDKESLELIQGVLIHDFNFSKIEYCKV